VLSRDQLLLNANRSEQVGRRYRRWSQLVVCVATVILVDALNFSAIAGDQQSTALLVGTVAFSVGFTIFGLRAGFSSLTTTGDGIRVSNTFSSFALQWSDVERFEIGRWKLLPYVCLIRLKDGRTLHATGIQESTRLGDGSAEDMVESLNAELARRA
jgi:hypothetical protein